MCYQLRLYVLYPLFKSALFEGSVSENIVSTGIITFINNHNVRIFSGPCFPSSMKDRPPLQMERYINVSAYRDTLVSH